MKGKFLVALLIAMTAACMASAQTQPNLENGWKPYGSYDGSELDSVNLMNGNLMFHAPLLPDQLGRNGLTMHYSLYGSSKDWQVSCFINSSQLWQCAWVKGRSAVDVQLTPTVMVHRTLDFQFSSGEAPAAEAAYGYTIGTPDGAVHQLHGVAGTEDVNGEPTQFDSVDLSGYHMSLNMPDSDGVLDHVTVTDRSGNQYQGDFTLVLSQSSCPHPSQTTLPRVGNYAPIAEDAPMGDTYCPETANASLITDSNGNQVSIYAPPTDTPTVDTLGRSSPFTAGGTTDASGCVLGTHTFYEALQYTYQDPQNITRYIKFCYAEVLIQTAFNQPNPHDPSVMVAEAVTGSTLHFYPVTTVVLGDGTHWTFDYDNYGELTYIGLPSGGSISYTWETVPFDGCDALNDTKRSRAVKTRTFNDGRGNTFFWQYQWGAHSSTGFTNTVTDPAGNDADHIFSELGIVAGTAGVPGGCHFYETSTIQYQGANTAGRLLQRVDTSYSTQSMSIDETVNTTGAAGLGNVFATDVTTTVYNNGNPTRVKLVHRDPDRGLGPGLPIFGDTIRELDYDWGAYPSHGPLLRETDTTYKWQLDSAYLTAGLLDLPAYVSVIDPSAAGPIKSDCHGWDSTLSPTLKACASETSYGYDEFGLQADDGGIPAGTLVAPPHGVRGNQTTVSRWLNTGNTLVSSNTHWYDTGEPYQKIDPLGHATTYTYSSDYAGAYPTKTCLQQTGTVTHCVSGTYNHDNGQLLSFTDENIQTSNYGYDLIFRLKSAEAPPDLANGNLRATTGFNYVTGGVPWQTIRTRSITGALTDSLTTSFDGLGRVFKTEHAMPSGSPSTVDTTYDLPHAQVTVRNPYFTTADSTYGSTTTQSDALGRPLTITEPDGSLKTFSYDEAVPPGTPGDCNLTVDEAGHQRRACSDALGRLAEVDEPNPASVATHAQASFTITRATQTSAATPGMATVTIGGAEGSTVDDPCQLRIPPGSCPTTTYDLGSVFITVNGVQKSASFAKLSTPSTVAAGLASAFHNDGTAPVDAWCSDSSCTNPVITLQARVAGSGSNYSLSASPSEANAPDFWATPSASTLTGGVAAGAYPDTGNLTITINNTPYTTSYAAGDTSVTIAQHLAAAISAGTLAGATAGSDGSITVTAKSTGPGSDLNFSLSSTYDTAHFSHSSLTFSPASGALAGGYNPGDASNQPFITLYSYDVLGDLLCVEQHGDVAGTGCSSPPSSDATSPWRVRRFSYDSLGRLLAAHNPESGTITYSYDADGNLLQKTSPAPNQTGTATQTISYCYDGLHRVTGKAYSAQSCPLASPAVTYTYDSGAHAIGHLTGVTDQAGSASYSYDSLGRLSSETRVINGIPKSLSYDYNLDGSVKALHYPSGAVVTYTPDSAGRFTSAVDTAHGINYVTSASYQADGQMTGFVSGNSGAFAGITSAFSYNKRLQPLNMSATAPSQTVFSIGYDFHVGNGTTGSDNGNVWNIYNYRDRTRDQSFNYDYLNRLTSAQNAGTNCAASTVNGKTEYWGNSYGYDPWGNLTQKAVTKCSAENLSLSALVSNRLSGYGYDAAGNMTLDPTDSVTSTYDAENRIATASTPSGVFTYTYDADGNRVEKSGGGTGTLYWYMTPGIIGESDLSGVMKSEYVFFNGERVARRDLPSGSVAYYFSDHLKTASVITDSAGNIKSESDYYPWGGELQFVNNDSNHYKFTGKERDTESGLDYFGARYYSNGLGRFITPDWAAKATAVPYAEFADPQSLNLYSYVRNIPTTRYDADGHADDLARARKMAVAKAWKQERTLVAAGQTGTVKWSAAQKAELLKTGRVDGYIGHHINNVANHPELAGDPNNIKFVKGQAANLAEHGGNFRNATEGPLLDRSLKTAEKAGMVVSVGIVAYHVATAPDGQKLNTAAKEGGNLGGAIAGGEAGAVIGSSFGPIGTAIGGFAGAIIGGDLHSTFTDSHGPGNFVDGLIGDFKDHN